MPNISNYKNHESPLLRAAYWLATLSFEDSTNFDVLQSLSKECEEAFQQGVQSDVATRCPVHGLKLIDGYCPSLTCRHSPPRR